MTLPNNYNGMRRIKGVNFWLPAVSAILVASLISWFMVTTLATPRSVDASQINRINNSMGHINDATTSLNAFTDYQNTRIDNLSDNTQGQFDDVNNSITDANNKISETQKDLAGVQNQSNDLQTHTDALQTQTDTVQTQADSLQTQADSLQTQVDSLQTQTNNLGTQSTQINTQLTTVSQKADNTKTALDTLTTKVNGLAGGLKITPSASSTAISLAIQSDTAQTIAFQIQFRPTTDISTTKATMDAALAWLYTPANVPVTLVAGSSVRGDYTLYWNTSDSLYHLGYITFITKGTSLSAGTNTKTITFSTTGSYEILVSPVYLTGTSTGSW